MENKQPQVVSSGIVNINGLNAALQQTLIHIDLTKTYYTISPEELGVFDEGGNNIWKDITLTSIGLGIPSLVNAGIEIYSLSTFIFNLDIFINALVGSICLISTIVCSCLWYKSTNKLAVLIKELKNRPQYKI